MHPIMELVEFLFKSLITYKNPHLLLVRRSAQHKLNGQLFKKKLMQSFIAAKNSIIYNEIENLLYIQIIEI